MFQEVIKEAELDTPTTGPRSQGSWQLSVVHSHIWKLLEEKISQEVVAQLVFFSLKESESDKSTAAKAAKAAAGGSSLALLKCQIRNWTGLNPLRCLIRF